MSEMNAPNPAKRPLSLMLLLAAAILVSMGLFLARSYERASQSELPHWVELGPPLAMALFGLVYWLYPEHLTPSQPVWPRRFAIFFFVLSAMMLVLYFV